MFTEELNLIREAEEQADRMRREARTSAKNLTRESDAEANRLVEEAFATEKEKCDALIEDGRRIAQQEYEETIAAAEKACAEMARQAEGKQQKAVNFIAERIVESSVNC